MKYLKKDMIKSYASRLTRRSLYPFRRAWYTLLWNAINSAGLKESPSKKKILWISQYYTSKNILRQEELDACVAHNLEQSFVVQAVLFCDQILPKFSIPAKAHCKPIKSRLTYQDVFSFVNTLALDDSWAIILSNTDIFLDESLVSICNALDKNDFVCLTRHELEIGLSMRNIPETTQDTWIFSPQICSDILCIRDIPLGVLGCDVALAAEMALQGCTLWNPCINTYTFHNHASQDRSYLPTQRIGKPYAYPRECTKEEFFLRRPRVLSIEY